jgi:hypothetical protein
MWMLSGWFALILNGVGALCIFAGVWKTTHHFHRLKVAALLFAGAVLMAGSVIIHFMRFR